ncbi:hypothetical protein BBJ28_00004401 [Nothophytophthora sp. Chile5]|nr:hypothetical protein BBJ28_00004401 [Nothophytophthora sp. Chile5]
MGLDLVIRPSISMEEAQVLALLGDGFLLAADGREGGVTRSQRGDGSQKETSFQGVVNAAEASNANQFVRQKKKRVRREKVEIEYLRGELDAVFMDQLARVEDALLHMEVTLRKPVFRDSTSSFVDAFMENDTIAAGGMAFIMQSCVAQKTDNLVAQSFGMRHTSDTIDVDLRGKYTFRRFNDHNCVVIVWTALLEPVELNGTMFHGLQCQQTGWIRHCGQQAGAIKSTRSQSYSRVAIEVQDDVEKQNLQVQVKALIDIARPTHESILAFCASMIEEMLVKEDWRQNGWADSLTL